MKLPTIIGLLLALFLFDANAGGQSTICPDPSSPDCVTTNWGVVQPDITDSVAPTRDRSVGTAPVSGRISMAVQSVPAASSDGRPDSLKSVISPRNLFVRETRALVEAIKRARFDADGSIVRGADRIAAAASQVAKMAGDKYRLTLYIQVPKLEADRSGALMKKVQSINSILAAPTDIDRQASPQG